ncbi:MAG: creatininase family protein [Methylobacteriaceae bacterium]|nr:creatininase family protein [Methylobacteriaceae bacterium]
MESGAGPTKRDRPSRRAALAAGLLAAVAGTLLWAGRPLTAPLPATLDIRDLTWVEVRSFIEHGYTTVIVPSGGLEGNGPHMAIGKHDWIVAEAARRVASDLGRTLVAPVLSFVPQGGFEPPSGNLRFPGTIGVSEPIFAGLLEGVARSLKAAGFRTICLIADHGLSLPVQREVAARLTREWAGSGVRVLAVESYYADAAQIGWLVARGETLGSIGRHAGIQDTSELLVVHPNGVKIDRFRDRPPLAETGSDGDPTRASAERGRELLDIKVKAAVAEIRAALGAS